MTNGTRSNDLTDLENSELAAAVDLNYVSDSDPGLQRRRWGRGFTYLTPDGKHLDDAQVRNRIDRMAIPPAWEEVWICLDPTGHIQATGRDSEGRKQYIYHPDWIELSNQLKFDRLLEFGASLPTIRAQVDRDLSRRRLSLPKVAAIAISLLDETLIRIGNSEYARANGSYGLTTLHCKHVAIDKSKVVFRFQGKSGVRQEIALSNRRLARQLKRCHELPGQTLFQYFDERDELRPLESADVNEYLREVSGKDLTAKDFRTWGATVVMLRELAKMPSPASDEEVDKILTAANEAVAGALQNTPTVCKEYYVHPGVRRAYRSGALLKILEDARANSNGAELDPEETALLMILERS